MSKIPFTKATGLALCLLATTVDAAGRKCGDWAGVKIAGESPMTPEHFANLNIMKADGITKVTKKEAAGLCPHGFLETPVDGKPDTPHEFDNVGEANCCAKEQPKKGKPKCGEWQALKNSLKATPNDSAATIEAFKAKFPDSAIGDDTDGIRTLCESPGHGGFDEDNLTTEAATLADVKETCCVPPSTEETKPCSEWQKAATPGEWCAGEDEDGPDPAKMETILTLADARQCCKKKDDKPLKTCAEWKQLQPNVCAEKEQVYNDAEKEPKAAAGDCCIEAQDRKSVV